jgi:hypothetical protein
MGIRKLIMVFIGEDVVGYICTIHSILKLHSSHLIRRNVFPSLPHISIGNSTKVRADAQSFRRVNANLSGRR